MRYGPPANAGKWHNPLQQGVTKAAPWWNESCAKAIAGERMIRRQENPNERLAAHASYKTTLRRAIRLHHLRERTQQPANNNIGQVAPPSFRDIQIAAQLAAREPCTGDIVYGHRALAAWKAHMQQHLSADKHPTAARYNDPATESDHQSTAHSSPKLSSGSSSSEAMHERTARTGPC